VDVAELGDEELAHSATLKLGLCSNNSTSYQLSALENVTLPMVYAGVNTDVRRDRAMAALKRVGLRIG